MERSNDAGINHFSPGKNGSNALDTVCLLCSLFYPIT
jgi:hypothetical protein